MYKIHFISYIYYKLLYMRRIIRLTESDIIKIVKRILEADETKMSAVDKFINELSSISDNIVQDDPKNYNFKKSVESIQTALEILGYDLPQHGIDGLFGPETKGQVIQYQKDNNLNPSGVVDKIMINKLVNDIKKKGINDNDINKFIQNFSLTTVTSDDEFYKAILTSLDAPITDDNMKFLYAWRQVEGGNATNNPFNTTYNLVKDSNISNYNKVGVKNYSTPQFGLEATIKTLRLPYYTDIVTGLRNDIGLDNLIRSRGLNKWSGNSSDYLSLFRNVVSGYASGAKPKPKPIA